MSAPPAFRNSDERDDFRGRIEQLRGASRDLGALRSDPTLSRYLLTVAGSDVPRMPTQTEIARAQDALDRAAACLVHHYRLRRRSMDDPDISDGKDIALGDELPF